jgi:hypothetical protein
MGFGNPSSCNPEGVDDFRVLESQLQLYDFQGLLTRMIFGGQYKYYPPLSSHIFLYVLTDKYLLE